MVGNKNNLARRGSLCHSDREKLNKQQNECQNQNRTY